jgi:hypothetical protein
MRYSPLGAPSALLAALLLAAGCTSGGIASTQGTPTAGGGPAAVPSTAGPVESGVEGRVCGSRLLDSPYGYDGPAGRYKSGTAGLPTYGKPGSDFPRATSGVVLAPGKISYPSYQLQADTVYFLLPGVHVGSFQADANDAFVGGSAKGKSTVVSGDYSGYPWAFDSNNSNGDQPGVTIEYLTIEKFQPNADAAAINQSSNTGWVLRYDTVTLNVPGAGMLAGADNVLADNCMTQNGQYGFQSSDDESWGHDSLTGGPYDVTIEKNEISYNDTCDFEGLLSNSAIGWEKYDPVPVRYRNPHCGAVVGDGDQGGFKLWQTNGVAVEGNYIHNNWGPGAWADTDNVNTSYTGNSFTGNDGEAIIEEISYNFSIKGNYMADNDWADGLDNPGFPMGAIYISESGSSELLGTVPACRESSCALKGAYPVRSAIAGNTLVNNGGGVFLWQNSDRHCSSGFDQVCTLREGGGSGPFSLASCKSNLPTASIDFTTFVGNSTGVPREDWWDGCLWQTANVSVDNNTIDFDPSDIPHCNKAAWPDCGANGIFSEYSIAPPYDEYGGWVIASQLTFFQNDIWSHNLYNGPSTFYAWNQGNPVSWADWTGAVAKGDKCGSLSEHGSGACAGPFGQDSGSVYAPAHT